jgi:hypothetical protein
VRVCQNTRLEVARDTMTDGHCDTYNLNVFRECCQFFTPTARRQVTPTYLAFDALEEHECVFE